MLKALISSLFTLVMLTACNSTGRGIFTKKTPREKYADRIEKGATPEALAWQRAGEKVLQHPVIVPAPYAENGIFTADSTDANAFLFSTGPGQKIHVSVKPAAGELFTAFLELWDAENPTQLKLIAAADTLVNELAFSAPGGGNFIVRLQPKLASRGRYDLSIALHPILGFPVSASVKSNIGSLWGAPRDAGVRKHEGIDIFAKKGSPVVAVAGGTVSRVSEGGIGGKVIWFNPDAGDFSVYYAHLDTQYVQSGQRLHEGQVMGTVGNTGNAKFTAAHLHFGIYTRNGAIDPLAFVQPVKQPAPVIAKTLHQWYKPGSKTRIYPSPKKENAFAFNAAIKFKTLSAGSQFYRVVLDNGITGFVAISELSDKMKL